MGECVCVREGAHDSSIILQGGIGEELKKCWRGTVWVRVSYYPNCDAIAKLQSAIENGHSAKTLLNKGSWNLFSED
jgi:hypothetical protein